MQEIFNSFQKSLERFREILEEEETVANRDSAIQRFEFTSELSWKLLQKFLRNQGIVCVSPKECLKGAFTMGLIEDDERWFEMIKDRNLTSHTYDEETAKNVYKRLPNYLELFEGLRKEMEDKVEEGE